MHDFIGSGGIWDSIRCSDMVHRQRGSSVRRRLPTCSDSSRRYHGFRCFGRTILLGRVRMKLLKLKSSFCYFKRRWRTIINRNHIFVTCRIIGAVLIIIGLYLVLWGKSEEKRFMQLEKAAIQSAPEHGNIRTPSLIKASLTQPLLPPSTESVWTTLQNYLCSCLVRLI